MGDAGIVDDHVEAPVTVDRRADHGVDIVPVGDIGMDIGAADFLGDRLAELVVQVGADDTCAFGGIAPGDGFAEAGGRAGDDGDLVLELHGDLLRWSLSWMGDMAAARCPTRPALATGREAPAAAAMRAGDSSSAGGLCMEGKVTDTAAGFQEDAMAGIFIAFVNVTDPEKYKNYTALTPAAVAAYDGEWLVRGGETETMEGPEETRRVVVIRFPSVERAREFWTSQEYQTAKIERAGAAEMQAILAEGA